MLDLLSSANLLARAERAGKAEQLRTFPKLRKAARTMASAMEVLMGVPQATEERLVSLVEVRKAIEEVVPREKLAAAVEAIAAAMAKSRRRYGPADIAAHDELITGSWGPLIFRNPDLPDGQIDKAAFVLCALMYLHHALRRRDVFAEGSERWSDPRARLLDGQAWEQA
ncbi:hypothetical protein AB0L65_35955 [Nonomuraea sp. NPDC052116]|uniref:hypothetical protein n=1 Tax=Nonomuraea sp. NPDC052116 TaxID=3155665 RepID=UPI0034471E32